MLYYTKFVGADARIRPRFDADIEPYNLPTETRRVQVDLTNTSKLWFNKNICAKTTTVSI